MLPDCEILHEAMRMLDALNCCEHPAVNCIQVGGELRVAQIIDESQQLEGFEQLLLIISSYLPPEIGNLTELVSIVVVENRELEGDLPSTIVKLKKLRVLDIQNTQVGGQLPYKLGEMKSLRTLNIFNSFLEGEIPGSICLLSSLEDLNLALNVLTGNCPTNARH
jgi:hypothetical protein